VKVVLFEDFPETIPQDINESAIAGAVALDDARDESLHSYGQRLTAGVSPASGLAETLVAIEGLVCQFMLGHGEARERHQSALTPWIEMGGQMTPPPVSVFPDSSCEYLTTRAAGARRADVRARLYDFRWERWGDVTGARGAIDAYLQAAETVDFSNPSDANAAMKYLIRAAEVALRVNHRQEDVRARIADYGRRALGGDYPSWLLEQTVDLLKSDPVLSQDLTDSATAAASDAAARGDRHTERSYLESALALARAIGRHDQAQSIRRSLAASHEAEATERAAEGGLIEVFTLTEALRAYMELGDTEAVQRIRGRLAKANERALNEMHTISAEVAIPNEDIERAVASLAAASSADPHAMRVVPRQLGFWPKWAKVEQERQDQGSVLRSLASTTIFDHDARSVPLPNARPERASAETIRQFAQRTMIGCGLAEIVLQSLRARGRWTTEVLVAAIADADATLGRASEPGVHAFESGEWWTALHILAPQVERAVRLIGARLNAPIHRVTTAQRLLWAQFDPMLEDPVIRAALSDDVAQELGALFTSEYGPNIRNNVAHGAADLDATKALAMVCLMAILTLADVLAGLPDPGSTEPPADDL
jgi:hypothetical protein